jgi:flavorubredoxin
MTTVTEIAPQLFRISTFVPEADLQFSQFLARDEEPLLFHTGTKRLFPLVREAVASLLDPARLRWIGFSHFEADECGSLNEWLTVAPHAEPVCSFVGKMVSVDDFAMRPARALLSDEVLVTGALRWRFQQTPHVPHCWEAGLFFEETNALLLCSDLFTHTGDVAAVTTSDITERARQTLLSYEAGPFAHYLPYTQATGPTLQRLADLKPRTLATMHGSVFVGDGAAALRDLARVTATVLGHQKEDVSHA